MIKLLWRWLRTEVQAAITERIVIFTTQWLSEAKCRHLRLKDRAGASRPAFHCNHSVSRRWYTAPEDRFPLPCQRFLNH